ncbi:hypothetical protein F4821DRAFT_123371 [Hypoxylon rubiginosum]|uniref:Uncharacterized protein n=1 Tax=Hypoxylon rubiginosum TaxID=110542 RepID=A0ACC0D2W3_9PEZI|nr:hypothetical protein F4821DRAFT_123371 [Hypoxylon rubiginosum]
MTPMTPSSIVTATSSTCFLAAVAQQQQGPSEFGMRLIHTGLLPPKAEKALRTSPRRSAGSASAPSVPYRHLLLRLPRCLEERNSTCSVTTTRPRTRTSLNHVIHQHYALNPSPAMTRTQVLAPTMTAIDRVASRIRPTISKNTSGGDSMIGANRHKSHHRNKLQKRQQYSNSDRDEESDDGRHKSRRKSHSSKRSQSCRSTHSIHGSVHTRQATQRHQLHGVRALLSNQPHDEGIVCAFWCT